jgi:glycosyltransferase involved in cell wall biosynthesis
VTFALDATPLTEPTGGVARYTWELACALAENYPEDEYWLLSDQAVRMPALPPGNLRQGSAPANAAQRRWWLYGLNVEMTRRGVDLFHGTDFSVPYFRRRPAVMTLHDLSPWMEPSWQPDAGRVRTRTPRLLRLKLADVVITPSEAVRREAIGKFGLDPQRVVAIPLAAAREFRPSTRAVAAHPYFLFVGTIEPRKNVAQLIDAWREVRKHCEVDLWIAGRVRKDHPPPVEEPGLRVLGAVPDADLPGLYSGALACVYPSAYEGFGLPVLEAMQCGTLVITSRDPAIMEVAGGAAIHVEEGELAGVLREVAQDPGRFQEMRDRALIRAAQFTWEKTARRTREVYEAACTG